MTTSPAPATLTAAMVVAHPDDETLWAGGLLLAHPEWNWFIATLCRASDPDRAPKFARVLRHLGATGAMADLDDGPAQTPLPPAEVQQQVLALLPSRQFDLLVTHGVKGEYTYHHRHVETYQAVAALWKARRISTAALWLFAYEDGGRGHLPRALPTAHAYTELPEAVWQAKYRTLTELYGFAPGSWEARAAPRAEAFWRFASPAALDDWLRDSQ